MALMNGFTLVFRLMVTLFIPRVTLRGACSMPHTAFVVGRWNSQSICRLNQGKGPILFKAHLPRAWGNFLSFDPSSYDLTTTAFFPAKRPASTTTTLPGLMLCVKRGKGGEQKGTNGGGKYVCIWRSSSSRA